MDEKIKHIPFNNKTNPKSYFEVIRIEDLLRRKLDHDIFKNHIVKFYLIFIVVEGKGLHTIDYTDYTFKKGTILLIRKDQIHKFHANSKLKGYMLLFTDEFIVNHLNELEALKSFQLFNELLSFPKIELKQTEDEFHNHINLVKQIEFEYELKDEYSIGITRSALHMLITKLFRIKSQQGQLPQKKKYLSEFLAFQNIIEKSCFERKKVKDYAQEMGVSTKTLNNIVKAIISKSAKTFIDEITIMQIKRLIINTNQSIKEIAYASGFDDPANFFKYFKKSVGQSPETFRQAHQ